ncbi:MAG: alpha/beta hydrolase [Robiginitomaculum sp.]
MINASKVFFLPSRAFGGEEKNKIAYKKTSGTKPGFIWCGGLKSDMEGSKAIALHDWAIKNDHGCVRFDYFGHGQSSGIFSKGTISRWVSDTAQVINELTKGPQILVGSSMGAWVATLAALREPKRIKAMLFIAPAFDFTEKLMWAGYDETIRKTIMEKGIYYEPSDYDEPYEISRALILNGRENLLMDVPINFEGPLRILQGMQDNSVPWSHAQKLIDIFTSNDIEMSLIKNGGHNLSGEKDIARMLRAAEEIASRDM